MEISSVLCALTAFAPQVPGGHWEGALTREGRAFPVRVDASSRVTVDFPDYGVYGLAAETSEEGGEIVVRAELVDAVLRGFAVGDEWGGAARFEGLEAEFLLRRTAAEPRIFVEEELRFASDDAELAGTLVKPPGDGPFPAVVWTHGSGPDTRRTPHYRGRAVLFAQHGVASLIYDKRGAGESTGGDAWKTERLANDARAGAEVLATRTDVDPARIGMAGFSQGGWVAPAAAAGNRGVAFVLVGATPGVTAGEQNLFSMRNRLRGQGFDEADCDEAAELMRALYELYETGEGRDAVTAAWRAAVEEPWFRSPEFQGVAFLPGGELPEGRHPYWSPFSPDPMEPWRALRVPALSVWGERDAHVPVETSRRRIEEALRAAGNEAGELIVFPRASHGLWLVLEDGAPWDWPRLAPGYHDALVRWVTAR